MSWYERLSRWVAGAQAQDGKVDTSEILERRIGRLETVVSSLRGQLTEMAAARQNAQSAMERLVAEEVRWESAARAALAERLPAEAKRCVARQLAAAEETKDFAAEVERRRREQERARAMLAELEDLVGRIRMRRDTVLAKERLRQVDEGWEQTMRQANDAAECEGKVFVRGWERFERAAENALGMFGSLGEAKEIAAGGLSASVPSAVPGSRAPEEPDESGEAAAREVEGELARLKNELRGEGRGSGEREEALDRLLDELEKP